MSLRKRIGQGVSFLAVIFALVTMATPTANLHADSDYTAGWPFGRVSSVEPVQAAIAAISTNTPILVKYVGTGSGKVAVAANGDLTFTDGTEGAEAANTDFECPVSGALGGVIDVSDAACDTLGEVVDTINGTCSTCAGTSSKWRAVILDGVRADSSNDTLATLSATAAVTNDGLALLADNTVDFQNVVALTPYRTMPAYLENRNNWIVKDPYVGQRASILIANEKTTYGSGASSWQLQSCKEAMSTASTFAGSETCTTLYSAPGGNTTVSASFDFTPYGLMGRKGEKLLVRVNNSAAMTAAVQYAYGFSWFYR
jgi:hypothetical protein